MSIRIIEFLQAEMARPHKWGETDCASMANRWVAQTVGIAPMAEYGRKHQNKNEAEEWNAECGGMVLAMNRIMRAANFKKTTSPKTGDIGLIIIGDYVCVAICAGTQWASRSENGFIGASVKDTRMIKSWSIE